VNERTCRVVRGDSSTLATTASSSSSSTTKCADTGTTNPNSSPTSPVEATITSNSKSAADYSVRELRTVTGRSTSPTRIGRERVQRLLFGVPADVGWRRDKLQARRRQGVTSVLPPVTTLASLLLATYYVAFAVYLLGNTALADQRVWGRSPLRGFVGYEDQAGAVMVFGGAGLVLAIATMARPIAPVVANVMTLPIAVISVMWFWLGVWPLGLIVVAGAAADLAIRAPRTVPP
jgi:hypothetical protein